MKTVIVTDSTLLLEACKVCERLAVVASAVVVEFPETAGGGLFFAGGKPPPPPVDDHWHVFEAQQSILHCDSLQTHVGQLALPQHDGELASQPFSPQLHGFPLFSLHVSSHPPGPPVAEAMDEYADSSTEYQLSTLLYTLVTMGSLRSTEGSKSLMAMTLRVMCSGLVVVVVLVLVVAVPQLVVTHLVVEQVPVMVER